MKNQQKNSPVFNYEYLNELQDFLNKESLDQESKLALSRRVLEALIATEKGQQDEHYRYIKKDPTEHKSLEYIIELFIKKEIPSLADTQIDYSAGIFQVMRDHGAALKEAVIAIINRQIDDCLAQPLDTIEHVLSNDLFGRYSLILKNSLNIAELDIPELTLRAQACAQKAIEQIGNLCEQFKYVLDNKIIKDYRIALQAKQVLELYQAPIADAWGSLRLSFLKLAMSRYALELIENQKDTENPEKPDTCCSEESCQHSQTE